MFRSLFGRKDEGSSAGRETSTEQTAVVPATSHQRAAAQPAPSNDAPELDRAEFERLVSAFPADGPVRFTFTTDPMDDAEIITFSLMPSHVEADDGIRPVLNIRARRKGFTTQLEDFCFIADGYLNRRGGEAIARIRWDAAEAKQVKVDASTNRSSIFFPSCELLCGIGNSNRLLIQILTRIGSPIIATFDLVAVRSAIDLLLRLVFGRAAGCIVTVAPFLLDRGLRFGPGHIAIYKEGLKDLGLYKGNIDTEKDAEFYSAMNRYAVTRHVGEMFGHFVPDNPGKLNLPMWSQFYKELKPKLQSRLGPMKISD